MKTKPLLPSLREKKRYLAYEIISENILSKKSVLTLLRQKLVQTLGTFDSAGAGIMVLPSKYDYKGQKGVLKVNHRYLDKVKAGFCLINDIDGNKVIVRSLGASGMINKMKNYVNTQ